MAMNETYAQKEPSRADIEAHEGPALLEFGTPWCGFSRAAQPLIAQAMAEHPEVSHFKIEDGRGKRLGRVFGVKLWPTLVFLDHGKEVGRLVRPEGSDQIRKTLEQIDPSVTAPSRH